jgi:hypothetical protein
MFILNGNPLPVDTPFEIDGTQYPANWLRLTSIEEKNAVGITEAPDPEPYDDRFYWGHDNPKDLNILKTNWTAQVKDTANKLLAQSDWMIIRKVERNVDVPADTTQYRKEVIVECTRLVTDISGCADVPALIAVVTTQGWPVNG